MQKLRSKIRLWWFYLSDEQQEAVTFLGTAVLIAFFIAIVLTVGIQYLAQTS